tara:strand:+ start:87 stop:929 length:843 start_codon:yes stop_codon:yes gene_type:complete
MEYIVIIAIILYIIYWIVSSILKFIYDTSVAAGNFFQSNVVEGGIKPFLKSATFSGSSNLKANINLEDFINYEYKEELTIKMAVMMALTNNKIDNEESKIIKAFMKNKMDSSKFGAKNFYKMQMDEALKDGAAILSNKQFPVQKITSKIKKNFNNDEKYEIIDLCMKILSADDKAESDEIKMIDVIANGIGIKKTDSTFAALKDKYLLKLSDDGDNSLENLEIKLGIDPKLPYREKRKYVVSQYKKWNSRLNILKDPIERKNAQKILDLLGEWRSKNKKK